MRRYCNLQDQAGSKQNRKQTEYFPESPGKSRELNLLETPVKELTKSIQFRKLYA